MPGRGSKSGRFLVSPRHGVSPESVLADGTATNTDDQRLKRSTVRGKDEGTTEMRTSNG